jgi:hypothetical protein
MPCARTLVGWFNVRHGLLDQPDTGFDAFVAEQAQLLAIDDGNGGVIRQ